MLGRGVVWVLFTGVKDGTVVLLIGWGVVCVLLKVVKGGKVVSILFSKYVHKSGMLATIGDSSPSSNKRTSVAQKWKTSLQ